MRSDPDMGVFSHDEIANIKIASPPVESLISDVCSPSYRRI
jgi:hypothetical protein